MPQRISVALCTFNGESFLAEQLKSIADQTRSPDELVVFDDGSTDRTVELLQSFAASVKFPVRIHQNPAKFGPAQNFGQAIAPCQGDIISLCDQDDIWNREKLALIQAEFARDPGIAFVFSDSEICDQTCTPLGYRLWQSIGFSPHLRRRFAQGHAVDVLLKYNVVTGATMSFASRYRSLLLPIGNGWMHDGWIALLLAVVSKGTAISTPLIRYRQHAGQSIGAAKRSLYQQYVNAKKMDRAVFAEQADQYEAVLARLQEQTDFDVPAVVIHQLQEKIQHCRRRSAIRLRQTTKLPALVELARQRYHRFSLGWKSFAQDLFL